MNDQEIAELEAKGRLVSDGPGQGRALPDWWGLEYILQPLASLKLTVALFAMAIFLILAGTLAQVSDDMWEVIDKYFRAYWTWIDFQLFFPPSFFRDPVLPFIPSNPQVPGGIPFPGGATIGLLMAVNLLSAHLLRFRVQARGMRALVGWWIVAIGGGVTWLVIASGSNKDGFQHEFLVDWSTLWSLFKFALGGLWVAMATALVKIESDRKFERWSMIGVMTGLGVLLVWLFFQGDQAKLDDSGMRILWQLIKATFAGLVLLGGCILLFGKRAGVVLLHGGVGLMMLSELLTAKLAVESQMHIREGETINYSMDIREVELAVIDHSDPEIDHVVVVPESILLSKQRIANDHLPFDVEVVEFFENSATERLKPGETSPADAGRGKTVVAREARSSTGTDSAVDYASAYVRLYRKGTTESLGTYLLSQLFVDGEPVKAGGQNYDVALRFKRLYKPYSVELIDVRKDDYMGTNTVRNYSSDIRLKDPENNVDREIHIWMNNPLRYAGETFYQSNYHVDPATGREMTGLQIVTNTGWMIPYVSCMIVAVGMLAHFWVVLLRFLNRRARGVVATAGWDAPPEPAAVESGEGLARFAKAGIIVPLCVVLLFGAWIAGKFVPPRSSASEMRLYEFGQLPVMHQGRLKPIDTLARTSLMSISGRQEFSLEPAEETDDGSSAVAKMIRRMRGQREEKRPAIEWFLDMVAEKPAGRSHHVFRIENLEVLELLELQPRKGFRYSLAEIIPKLRELTEAAGKAREAREKDPESLSLFQRKVLELESKIGTLDLLLQAFSQPRIRQESAREDLVAALAQQRALQSRQPPLVIPPAPDTADEPKQEEGAANAEDEKWMTYAEGWTKDLVQTVFSGQEPHPAVAAMTSMLIAYSDDDAAKFNEALKDYRTYLDEHPPEGLEPAKVRFESYFNHSAPFYYAAVLYVVAFVIACSSWLGWAKVLNRSAFWLLLFTVLVHTGALVARMYISGRPPVTNLYSSSVFIGWACVLISLGLEAVYRLGVGNVVAAVTGFASLLIAHFLSLDGDTFTVLVAVLDTQFWLATHVVCITLGYATTFLAGGLGIVYVLRGVLTRSLDQQTHKDLSRMIYGILCFAIFFSFVGTVLGGLWADDSWGRFWGWDPKENGALIIVLWNALVLHARWDGMVKERGMAVLAIAGNIVTSWSWFGVNELGVGLHSYGFTEGVLLALGGFVLSQLAIMGIGSLPLEKWRSFRA